MDEKTVLRVRDFWTSIFLILVSCFFIYKTTDIPFLDTKVAGVDAADWYNSAALVPFSIFGGMLLLALVLLFVAIRDGGARHAFEAAGIGYSRPEAMRSACVCLMLFFYLFGLVPRVDFILASALMITGLIWGFHRGNKTAMLICTATIAFVSLYALVMHFPRAEWVNPHDDDWVTLVGFLFLTTVMFINESRGEAWRLLPGLLRLCRLWRRLSWFWRWLSVFGRMCPIAPACFFQKSSIITT